MSIDNQMLTAGSDNKVFADGSIPTDEASKWIIESKGGQIYGSVSFASFTSTYSNGGNNSFRFIRVESKGPACAWTLRDGDGEQVCRGFSLEGGICL